MVGANVRITTNDGAVNVIIAAADGAFAAASFAGIQVA